MMVQTTPPIDSAVEVEIQRRINDLESRRLDVRATWINRWLSAIGILLTFFAIVVPIAGYIGYSGFNEQLQHFVSRATSLANKAEETGKKANDLVVEAGRLVVETRAGAIASAKMNKEIKEEKEERERYLEKTVQTYMAKAFWHMGNVEGAKAHEFLERDTPAALRQFSTAIAHYTDAIHLNPNYAEAYSNRGNTRVARAYLEEKTAKATQQFVAAIADYTKSIRLKPNYAETYFMRGNASNALAHREEDSAKAVYFDQSATF